MVSWLSMSDPNYGVVFQLLHKLKQTGHIVSIELNKSERMLRVIRLDISKQLYILNLDSSSSLTSGTVYRCCGLLGEQTVLSLRRGRSGQLLGLDSFLVSGTSSWLIF